MITRLFAVRLAFGAMIVASLGAASYYFHRTPAEEESCCADDEVASAPAPSPPPPAAVDVSRPLTIPDTPLVDHHGRPVRFYSDLVRGRVVAIQFIFTTCRGVCPPMGATFGKLQEDLGGRGVQLISVSVDPASDSPEQLAEWGRRFDAGPGWTLVTGRKPDVDGLLQALGVFSADKADHSPFLLLGDDRTGRWRRIHGLSAPETIEEAIEPLLGPPGASSVDDSPAHRYFTDVPLVNQYGETMRLYSDLLRGKVVVIHVFFAACRGTCPVMMTTDQKLQDHLGDRLGRDVVLISLTVDPGNDRWQELRDYAGRLGARRGWYLLTGAPEDVALALRKLGQAVERREEHSNLFIIGNEPTQLWKKVHGLAPAEQIIAVLDGVLADREE